MLMKLIKRVVEWLMGEPRGCIPDHECLCVDCAPFYDGPHDKKCSDWFNQRWREWNDSKYPERE